MFNPERILGHLLRGSLRGAVHEDMSWASKAGLGMGVLGVAMAAFEHFSEQSNQSSASPSGPAGPPPVPPPLPGQPIRSTPVAGMMSSPAATTSLPPLPPAPPAVPPPVHAATPVIPTSASPPVEPPRSMSVEPATVLIRAMISAANADGVIDAEERANIMRAAQESGLNTEELAFLQREIDKPWSLRDVADHADTPDLRKQVYIASRMAITVDSESERRYLQALSVALYLTTDEVAQLEAQLGE